MDVHRAARISAAAHGGQVLLVGDDGVGRARRRCPKASRCVRSASTCSRTSRSPSGCASSSSTDCRPTSRRRTPSPRGSSCCRAEMTSFVGREEVLAQRPRAARRDAPADLDRPRRNGQDAARRFASRGTRRTRTRTASRSSRWPSISDPTLVLPTIRQALGLVEQPGRTALETLVRAARRTRRAARARQLRAGRRRGVVRRARCSRRRPGADAPGHQPRRAPHDRRAGVPGAAARSADRAPRRPISSDSPDPRRSPSSSSARGPCGPTSRLTPDNARDDRRDLRSARWAAAGHRARRLAHQAPAAWRAAGSAQPEPRCAPVDGGRPDRPPAHPARRDRLELRPADRRPSRRCSGAAPSSSAAGGSTTPRRCLSAAGLLEVDLLDGVGALVDHSLVRQVGARQRAALHDARDDPRVRPRAAGRDRASSTPAGRAHMRARFAALVEQAEP